MALLRKVSAGRLRPLVLLGFAIAILAIVSLGVTVVGNLRSVETDTAWVTHTYDVIAGLADVLSGAVDSGSGARAFVNSGNPSQLALHERGNKNALAALERVQTLTRDDPSAQARLSDLRKVLEQRSQLFGSIIDFWHQSPELARNDARWNETPRLTERMRGLLDQLGRHQSDLLRDRQRQLARRALIFLVVIGVGCGLLLVFVLATFFAALRHERGREKLVSYQGELMGVVGHDLRSPLSAIMMSVSLLASDREISIEKRVSLSRRALASARRMERIIRDLLDFTRERVGEGITIEVASVDFGELCEKVTAELAIEYPNAILKPSRDGDLRGEWDADRLAQIVSNLVINAIKYGREGSEIQIQAHAGGDQVRLEVRNQGDAIPPQVQPYLFEPFQAGRPPPRAGAHGRVGLGLHIVRAIAEAHGGDVAVSSNSEATTFAVTLPKAQHTQRQCH